MKTQILAALSSILATLQPGHSAAQAAQYLTNGTDTLSSTGNAKHIPLYAQPNKQNKTAC